ncbi:MAG: hypothetical protein JRH19_14260 [Deltaproteobacteria bacterium]|nr:hypothetical protein [Deltaproteobacteria bacterium]
MVWIQNRIAKRVLRTGTGFLAAVLTLSMAISTASADPAETRAALERVLTLERSVSLLLGNTGAAQQIDEGLALLDLLTDEELVMMGDLAPALADLESHLALLKENLENALDDRAPAPGFASPPSSPPQTDISLVDAGYSGLCGDVRENTEIMFGLKVALDVAEGIWMTASRGCDQIIVGIGAGGNGSVACIVGDLIFLGLRTTYEAFEFCDADTDSAEIEGAYERAASIFSLQEHLHADIATHDAEIKALLEDIQAGIERNYEVGLDIIRLLNTPKGRRTSDWPACGDGQPCDYPDYERIRRSRSR